MFLKIHFVNIEYSGLLALKSDTFPKSADFWKKGFFCMFFLYCNWPAPPIDVASFGSSKYLRLLFSARPCASICKNSRRLEQFFSSSYKISKIIMMIFFRKKPRFYHSTNVFNSARPRASSEGSINTAGRSRKKRVESIVRGCSLRTYHLIMNGLGKDSRFVQMLCANTSQSTNIKHPYINTQKKRLRNSYHRPSGYSAGKIFVTCRRKWCD